MGGTGEFVEPSTGLTRCVPRGNVQFRSVEKLRVVLYSLFIFIHYMLLPNQKYVLSGSNRNETWKIEGKERDLNRFLDSSWDCCAVYPKLGKSFSCSLSLSIPIYISYAFAIYSIVCRYFDSFCAVIFAMNHLQSGRKKGTQCMLHVACCKGPGIVQLQRINLSTFTATVSTR